MSEPHPKKHLLIIEESNNEQRVINLESATYSIGRDLNNLIVISSSQMSRYHATLLRITIPGTNDFQFRIIDGDLKGRRSRNGFKVNENACVSHDLQNNDVITFGKNIIATYKSVVDSVVINQVEPSFFPEDDDEDATSFFVDSKNTNKVDLQKTAHLEEERKASIQQSLERLASFPELFSNPIIELDVKGNIIYLNPAALKTFPSLQKDRLQHPILCGIISLIVPLIKNKDRQQTSLVREVEINNKIFQQSIHLISASQLIRCYVTNITKRKQAEKLLKKNRQELEKRVEQRTLALARSNDYLKGEIIERKRVEQEIRLLQTITQAITEASNFQEAIAITLRKVCETIGWSYGEAWIPDEKNQTLTPSPSCYFSSEKLIVFREVSHQFSFAPGVGVPGRVLATQKFEWIKDVTQQHNQSFLRNQYAEKVGLKTALGVPIIAEEKVIAVFVFFDSSALDENKRTVKLVNSVASQLGLIMERKKAEDALRSSMGTNRAILNAIPDVIFRINKKGTFVNYKAPTTEKLLILKPDFLGKHINEVFPKEVALSILNCLERAFTIKEVQILECELPAKDKVRNYEIRIAISEVEEVMAIMRDITERKQAEEDARRTLEQEKKLNELKSRFVTMASHEFRTPLASILSSSELLEHYSHKWSEEKKLSHLHRIQTSVKHMTELLNDVLLVGKADAGKLQLNPSKINLLQFCQDLVAEIQLTTQTHQIIFQTKNRLEAGSCQKDSDADKCNVAYMDEKMLRHILHNLLSNAIKYSPEGDKVIFDLICQSKEAIFRVQDFGIGVPPDEQNQLFDSFHRANNVGSIPGTGLGLPIVKRAVDLHGGTIAIDSEEGEGTTFTVTLPYLANS